jgi:hypothetical protein
VSASRCCLRIFENEGYSGIQYLVGGFNPSEKYESQLGLLFPYIMENKNVPNHQPGTMG